LQNQLLTQNLFNMKTQNPKFIILLICFLAFSFNVKAQTYDPYAVQLINNLIANNGLQATPDAPETWFGVFTGWNDEIPKQLTHFTVEYGGLTGEISFTGLQSLIHFNCGFNSITKLDLSNNPQLLRVWAHYNQLTEINLTNCNQLQQLSLDENKLTKLELPNSNQKLSLSCPENNLSELNLSNCKFFSTILCYENNLTNLDLTGLDIQGFSGRDQRVSLTLIKNETNEYTCSILLNSPIFEHSAISYYDGILKNIDKNVWYTDFTVQTNHEGCELSGTMRFTYSDVGIITPQKKEKIKVYPNPTTGELTMDNGQLTIGNVEVFDIYGRKQFSILNPQSSIKKINISHLTTGIYFIKITTEQGVITKKVIKH